MVWSLFLEGLLSFFTPCVLPLVPLYIGYLTSDQKEYDSPAAKRIHTAAVTFFFVLGICTVFFIAGLGTSVLREFFSGHRLLFLLAGGFLLLVLGAYYLGMIQIPFLERERRIAWNKPGKGGYLNAWLMGFFFSFAWSPCIGPLLTTAIITAAGAATRAAGWLYLGAYSLGFISMFILIGLFTEEVLALINKRRSIVKYTKILGGLVIVGMGCYMLYQSADMINKLQNPSQQSMPVADAESETAGSEGDPAQSQDDLTLYGFTLSDGEKDVNIKDYKGKTIVVNFFGTWCSYCNQELPALQKMNDTRDNVKVFLIAAPGLNGEGDIEYVQKYMGERGYTMDILYDLDYAVTRKYGISGYPTTFIIQPDGMFYQYYIPGYIPEDVFMEHVDKASQS